MEAWMSPYVVLLFLFMGLGFLYHHVDDAKRRLLVGLCFLAFVLFFGLRGNVGDDYVYYQKLFACPSMDDFLLRPAFTLLMAAFNWLHIPFAGFLLATSVFTNYLLFRFLVRQGVNVPWVLCIFLGMSGVANEMDFLRSTISLLLFANSLEYIVQERPGKFLLWNGVGVLFHYSALLYLPCYYLFRARLSKKLFAALIAVGFVAFLLRLPFLDWIPQLFQTGDEMPPHFLRYISYFSGVMPFTLATLERLLTAAAVYLLFERLQADAWSRMAVYAFLLYFLCISVFSHYAILATRLANLFVFGYWLLWPALLRQLPQRRYRYGTAFGLFGYLLIRLFSLSSLPQWHYTTVFS